MVDELDVRENAAMPAGTPVPQPTSRTSDTVPLRGSPVGGTLYHVCYRADQLDCESALGGRDRFFTLHR
jgi:hypothetical protein